MLTSVILILWAGTLAVLDWRSRRLPNWLLACGLGIGALHGIINGVMPYGASVLDGLGTAMVALLAFWPAYRAGWMGAGDVKLCATLGWLGGVKVLLATLLIGTVLSGLIGLAILVPALSQYLSGSGLAPRLRQRIPFGAALAVAFIAWTTFGIEMNPVRFG